MNFSDLRMFVAVTQHANLQDAAQNMNVTSSALSKAIRRLEGDLGAPLFDRSGKSLKLNFGGQRLLDRALAILHLAEQAQAEFEGAEFKVRCKIAAPALLQWRFGTVIAQILSERYADSSLTLRPAYEDEAFDALLRGEVDFAIVTNDAFNITRDTSAYEAIPLGTMTMQLAAGRGHPLVRQADTKKPQGSVQVTTEKVLRHDFACPTRSMFCGLQQGKHSDGWHDAELPRRIRYWVDDLQVLLSLVQSDQALAYLPEFALKEYNLIKIQVTDCPFQCTASAHLVWRPVTAAGWQTVVVDAIKAQK